MNKTKVRGKKPKITQATLNVINEAGKEITTQEILKKVVASGAKFSTPNPLEGIRAVLYKLKKDGKIGNPGLSRWEPLTA
jgi:hypothetical protein